jgi:hypothetical protein
MVEILKESRKIETRFGTPYSVVLVQIEAGLYGTALKVYNGHNNFTLERQQPWESKERAEEDYEARKSFHCGR